MFSANDAWQLCSHNYIDILLIFIPKTKVILIFCSIHILWHQQTDIPLVMMPNQAQIDYSLSCESQWTNLWKIYLHQIFSPKICPCHLFWFQSILLKTLTHNSFYREKEKKNSAMTQTLDQQQVCVYQNIKICGCVSVHQYNPPPPPRLNWWFTVFSLSNPRKITKKFRLTSSRFVVQINCTHESHSSSQACPHSKQSGCERTH